MYKLMIADGDAAAREHIRALVPWDELGFGSIDEAATYASAVELALRTRPQAALVALELGGRYGYDLVAQLQSAGLKTVFCVMADAITPELVRNCMRSGARDYLLKPLTAHELHAFLARALQNGPGEPFAPAPYLDAGRLTPLTRRILAAAHDSMQHPPVSLVSIAETLHMNSKYLGRVFLRDTGMKLSEYLFVCRMEKAKQMVLYTNEKISAIANAVGYSQLNRFYVHFRAYFGVSPGTMRDRASPPKHFMLEE